MNHTYKIRISNRSATEYDVVDAYSLKIVAMPKGLNPIQSKLMNQDIFRYDNASFELLHSSARSMEVIPGVLVLEGNKTFGKRNKKYYYKCIPDDKRLPIFLVAYSVKLGFNKNIKNKYVVFKYKEWTGKHPVATLVNTLGDVTELDNFYEYQLYCKSLYASIQNITKKAMKALRLRTEEEYIEDIIKNNDLEDYRERNIISIDPATSRDFDDAFDIEVLGNNRYRIGIYISNVSFWMDALDLWDSFSSRISTIYLPDRKRPMLPTVLSDALCSLTEHDLRFALCLNLIVSDGEIESSEFKNCLIKVLKNHRYDTKEQEDCVDYKIMKDLIYRMNRKKRYVDSIDTSHDVIAYLMITYNYISAIKLNELNVGIFRSAKFSESFKPPEHISPEIKKFLKHWNSLGGKYCKTMGDHDMLELEAYVHITSPIRRLVDLLNIMILQDKLGLHKMSEKGNQFYEYWTCPQSIDYINMTMRSVRKVQNDCAILKICSDDKSILSKTYEGFIFDKIVRNDLLYQYMVYLPELKMVNRFTSRHDRQNQSSNQFKLYIFTDESTLKQKIRVELLEQ